MNLVLLLPEQLGDAAARELGEARGGHLLGLGRACPHQHH